MIFLTFLPNPACFRFPSVIYNYTFLLIYLQSQNPAPHPQQTSIYHNSNRRSFTCFIFFHLLFAPWRLGGIQYFPSVATFFVPILPNRSPPPIRPTWRNLLNRTPAQPATTGEPRATNHERRNVNHSRKRFLENPKKIKFFISLSHNHLQILTIPKIHDFSTKCASSSNYGGRVF